MHPTTVMRAIRSGIIKGDPGRPRTIVTAGESTAHAGHPIVRDHPHLWGEIVPEFPVVEDQVDAAVRDSGGPHTEAIRDLLSGLVERGYSLPDPDDVPADEVAAVVVRIALNNLPPAGVVVDEAGAGWAPPLEPEVIPAPNTEGGPHPVAGDLRRTEDGQLQEWGDGMWHDVDDPPEVAPNPDPTGADDLPADELEPGVAYAESSVDETTDAEPAADLSTKEGRTAVREWAEEHGYEVKPTGPLPQAVVDAYQEAHPGA